MEILNQILHYVFYLGLFIVYILGGIAFFKKAAKLNRPLANRVMEENELWVLGAFLVWPGFGEHPHLRFGIAVVCLEEVSRIDHSDVHFESLYLLTLLNIVLSKNEVLYLLFVNFSLGNIFLPLPRF